MKKILVILLLSGIAWGQLQAQDVVLQLDSCYAMAMRNQAKIKNAELSVEAAHQTKMAAFSNYFPKVSAMAGYFHSLDYMIDISTDGLNKSGAQINIDMDYNGNNLSGLTEELRKLLEKMHFNAELKMLDHGAFANAMVTQPIFAGGRIVTGNKLAKLGENVAELQMEMAADEVSMSVEERYWMVVSLTEKLKVINQAKDMLDTLRRDAEAATEAGVIGNNDLLKVKLKQNEIAAAKIQLNNGINLATQALLQYIGMPYNPEMGYRMADTIDMNSELDIQLFSAQKGTRIEAKLLEKSVEAERLKHRMILGEALPQIAIGGTYGVNNILNSGFKSNGMVFATASIPLTAWWETAHKMKQQKIQQQIAENNRQDLVQQLELQNQQVLNEMLEAHDLVKVKKQAVDDAQANMDEAQNYYDAGLTGVSDFLEAQAMLLQAQTDLVDQSITYRLKHLKWKQLSK